MNEQEFKKYASETMTGIIEKVSEEERDFLYLLVSSFNEKCEKVDTATNYYLKTLAKNGSMPDEAAQMFNLLEENKR